VMMSLAAVGLIRMVDTSTLVVGNLAFKQSTTSAADRTAEEAIAWLQTKSTSDLFNNSTADGYYATSLNSLDITGKSTSSARSLADWGNDDCAYADSTSYTACFDAKAAAASPSDYKSRFLITRMCEIAGDPNATANSCAKPSSSSDNTSPKRGELKYGEDKRFGGAPSPYYRIIVRSEGPRNTVSFTETYVHF
jgi:type IV pilus assembly protein PilX